MIGAITGDIIGSVYEFNNIKTKAFPLFSPLSRFTDDTVLTVAIANAIISETPYCDSIRSFGRAYPNAGYGSSFKNWLFSENTAPYNSFGNGSAMRVSPVGFAFNSIDEVLKEAKLSAEITHNHPEGIKGAQATALTIYLARKGADRDTIKKEINDRFGYNLDRSIDEIRANYTYDVSCQGTVPEAIISFLESRSYEDAIRNAISIGGDSDTLACITGSISEAFYGPVPEDFYKKVEVLLPAELMGPVKTFYDVCMSSKYYQDR